MFRCITELKGLIIDVDSFAGLEIREWKDLIVDYKCLFLVSNEELWEELIECYGAQMVYKVERFKKLFAPSKATHTKALDMLGLQPTEAAYVSVSHSFLHNAMGFLGGTIWITNKVSYEQASNAPDLICSGFEEFKTILSHNIKGFLGEAAVFPDDSTTGMIIRSQLDVDGDRFPIYMLGRYFGYVHYMNQLHPYSAAIYYNKREGKPYYGKFDDIFVKLYSCAIKNIQKVNVVDGVVAVPTRPGKKNRFAGILEGIAKKCNILNYGECFRCIEDYPSQKGLSSLERQDNIQGVFGCEKSLSGNSIVIIDDIITTGATLGECVRTLKVGGVKQVFIVVLGINQIKGNYWSSNVVKVACPDCGDKMHLLINSHKKSFFYSCYSCRNTLDYQEGRELLCEEVNSELNHEG